MMYLLSEAKDVYGFAEYRFVWKDGLAVYSYAKDIESARKVTVWKLRQALGDLDVN